MKPRRDRTSEQKVEAFLTGVAKRGVVAATQMQALSAVRVLYLEVLKKPLGNVDALRVRRPAHVRVALSVEEVRRCWEHWRMWEAPDAVGREAAVRV